MERHIVIGDCHSCGEELRVLLESVIKVQPEDKIYSVGDLFDRGFRADLVFSLIQKYNIQSVQGNHERKLRLYLEGGRKFLPPHYFYAIKSLEDSGVSKEILLTYLQSLPDMIQLPDLNAIIVHAGADPTSPLTPNVSWNVYGSSPKHVGREVQKIKEKIGKYEEITPEESLVLKRQERWYDVYKGDIKVIFGHESQESGEPIIKKNVIGLDTKCCRGGFLTAYCIEENKFYFYQSHTDHFALLKQKMSDDLRKGK